MNTRRSRGNETHFYFGGIEPRSSLKRPEGRAPADTVHGLHAHLGGIWPLSMKSAAFLFLLLLVLPNRAISEQDAALVSPRMALIDNLAAPDPAHDDWPWWRGPTFDNQSPDRAPPLHWGPGSNVLWKVSVPGRGHATPAIWGPRV